MAIKTDNITPPGIDQESSVEISFYDSQQRRNITFTLLNAGEVWWGFENDDYFEIVEYRLTGTEEWIVLTDEEKTAIEFITM